MDRIYRIKHGASGRYAVERDGKLFWMSGDVFGTYSVGDEVPGGSHQFLAPVSPSIVVCIGLNYKDHAAEVKKPLPAEPLLFLKPSTAVVGPGDPIVIPAGAGRVDHEAEMGVVIGATARSVNGTRRQFSSTRELIFPVAKLIAFISAIMTLLPGDIITTGTPSGIGPLAPGDRVTIKVQGVGELTNPVGLAIRQG